MRRFVATLWFLLLVTAALGCSGAATGESGTSATPVADCQGLSCSLEALARDSEQRESWSLHETASFRVFHYDQRLANRLASEAERQRERQLLEWQGVPTNSPWVPRCDLYLYPSNKLLVSLSGGKPKAGSAASSPSKLYRGRIIRRRIDLAADDPRLFTHTLPHEISHVVVESLLGQRPPLWAHEGLATLEEPASLQNYYNRLVARAVATGRAFSIRALMEMVRYPDQEYVGLYYAQSFSLTRLLVETKGRAAFLEFLRAARPGQAEAALQRHFGWDLVELQRRWESSLAGGSIQTSERSTSSMVVLPSTMRSPEGLMMPRPKA